MTNDGKYPVVMWTLQDDNMVFRHKCIINIIRMLLEAGADINAKNDTNSTALMWASCGNNPSTHNIILYLIENGADLTAMNNNGLSALNFSSASDAKFNNIDIQESILNNQPQSIPFFENRCGFKKSLKKIPRYADLIETYMAAAEFGMFTK